MNRFHRVFLTVGKEAFKNHGRAVVAYELEDGTVGVSSIERKHPNLKAPLWTAFKQHIRDKHGNNKFTDVRII